MNTLLVVTVLLLTQLSGAQLPTQGSIDPQPVYSGPGFTVGGKVIDRSGTPEPNLTRHATLSPVGPGTVLGGSVSFLGSTIGDSLGDTFETLVRADGSFEFPAVPPGPYVL